MRTSFDDTIRFKVLSAFDGTTYSHVVGGSISGIDNLGILSLLAGASHLKKDYEIEDLAVDWINRCLSISEDCRNFDVMPHEGWEQTVGYYWKKKSQANAGPIALEWARKIGCNVPAVWDVSLVSSLLTLIPSWIIRLKPFRQHLNTVMLAHLFCGIKSNWSWVTEYNALYSYIDGIKCHVPHIGLYKTDSTSESEDILPINLRVKSQWIWKQWPWTFSRTVINQEYTPTALLVAQYLQDQL